MRMMLSEIATEFHGTLIGDDVVIERLARLEDAQSGELSFLQDQRYRAAAVKSHASAILVKPDEPAIGCSLIRVENPYAVFQTLLPRFHPPLPEPTGIHPTAVIGTNVTLGENVSIGPLCVIGDNSTIGSGTILYGHVWVGREVQIGEQCRIYPQVSLRDRVELRNRVVVKEGAVIGSEGFAFLPDANGVYQAVPQLGTVVLQDGVSIGANACVDRALSGATIIETGTKLDNMVHIAHNVRVGAHTVIAAQTGVSGSTRIGAYNRIGGQVGFNGHIETVDHATIAAQSGVTGSVHDETTVWGTPAIPHRLMLKIAVLWKQLPDLFDRVKKLEQKI